VAVREVEIDGVRLDHADPTRLGQLHQAGDGAGVEPGGGHQDERTLGAGQDARGLVDPGGVGEALDARLAPGG